MAQKKKKGPAPQSKEAKKKRWTTGQVVFVIFSVLMVLSMIITTIGPSLF